MARESMEFDVVIVGAGVAGLSAAIRLRQLAETEGRELSVCVLEKGSEVGAHVLSGAVLEPRALDELLPEWREEGGPPCAPVVKDRFLFLTGKHAIPFPTPPQMNNHGNVVASVGLLTRWMAERAEALGAEIYPGFAAAEVLFDADGRVVGVATGDVGLQADGTPGPRHEEGMELRARFTLFAEGCRGSLSESLIERFGLRDHCDPQTYGLGVKEVWEVDPERHRAGSVTHTIGWPMDRQTYGGSFLYHMPDNQVAVGFIVGLDYANPYLSPFEEMQRFKTHPAVRPLFEGARRIAYGARALNEGGFQSIPELVFPGGALIGAAAGFMNVPKIKGTHTAMKSAMLAAEAAFAAVVADRATLDAYPEALRRSWVWPELRRARNIRPSFHKGMWAGLVYSAVDTFAFFGRAPWTFHHNRDRESLRKAADTAPIEYPKPDGTLTFDRLSSVYLANVAHEESQPCHLRLTDPTVAVAVNLNDFAGPEARYCPAQVYEFVETDDGPALQINAANCIHCKTCDIKDPTRNIRWVTPEGGSGPNYPNL